MTGSADANLHDPPRGGGNAFPDDTFAALPLPETDSPDHGPRRICIATPDIVGPIRTGGIGSAYRNLAHVLSRGGHDITILYTLGKHSEDGPIQKWVAEYAKQGIKFVPCPDPEVGNKWAPMPCQRSYAVYDWLKRQESFRLVHFPEWSGHGYYSLLAHKLGIAFDETMFCVGTHSPTFWNMSGNGQLVKGTLPLLRDFMERKSVEWADFVVSPSQYMLRWMKSQGWTLPDRCYVHPNAPEAAALEKEPKKEVSNGNLAIPNEIVFFGRLDPRKGVHLFCDAVTRLASRTERQLAITFLGKAVTGPFNSHEFIKNSAKKWPFEYRIITNYNSKEACEYLSEPGRVAVMPSLIDNSPQGVQECAGRGIPFLVSNTGGIPDLILEADHETALFNLNPEHIAEKFDKAISEGITPSRSATDIYETRDVWVKWHSTFPQPGRRSSAKESGNMSRDGKSPHVSVCLIHHNRSWGLEQALDSLKKQTYSNFEVIVVDDGSTDAKALAFLDALESEDSDFSSRGWRLIRQKNLYVGAARNNASRSANGEYLLFMDDDNYAKPHEIEKFVEIMERNDADILTCFADYFRGEDPPDESSKPERRIMFLGPVTEAGPFLNLFGDTNCLIRASVFRDFGGFSEDFGVGLDDQEFFARMALKGARFYVVPEPLYWYRESAVRLRDKHYKGHANIWRVIRPYQDIVPRSLRNILPLAQGLFHIPKAAVQLPTSVKSEPKLKLEIDDITRTLLVYSVKEYQNNNSRLVEGDLSFPLKVAYGIFKFQLRIFLIFARIQVAIFRGIYKPFKWLVGLFKSGRATR
ncbi:MAG: glycosyltransferase [Planctomycetota bacterium]|jgi:glycosyltransferase involved in cell wall biosynthesis